MKLKVTSARESFRRSGLEFTREPRLIDVIKLKLTDEQIAGIINEPNLNVQQGQFGDEPARSVSANKAAADKATAADKKIEGMIAAADKKAADKIADAQKKADTIVAAAKKSSGKK